MTMSLLDVPAEPPNSTSSKTTATSVQTVKPPQKVQVSMANFSLWAQSQLVKKESKACLSHKDTREQMLTMAPFFPLAFVSFTTAVETAF